MAVNAKENLVTKLKCSRESSAVLETDERYG